MKQHFADIVYFFNKNKQLSMNAVYQKCWSLRSCFLYAL